MKKITAIFFVLLALQSCEKIIDVDLETAEPRLVIDALITWQKGTSGETQKIKLTTTTDYFGEVIPTVSGAVVFITTADQQFDFIDSGNGEYICNNFIPVLGQEYTLTVHQGGQTYVATETMRSVPEIENIEQFDDGGFTGDNIEIRAYFTDNAETDDFYMTRIKADFAAIPEYNLTEDRLFQGNTIFSSFSDEELSPGDHVDLTLYGISEGYFNFMRVLLSVAGSNGGGPFQSPPATVRGNIVNTTNQPQYALGFFALCETDFRAVVIE